MTTGNSCCRPNGYINVHRATIYIQSFRNTPQKYQERILTWKLNISVMITNGSGCRPDASANMAVHRATMGTQPGKNTDRLFR